MELTATGQKLDNGKVQICQFQLQQTNRIYTTHTRIQTLGFKSQKTFAVVVYADKAAFMYST